MNKGFDLYLHWDWSDWQIGFFGLYRGLGIQLLCFGITVRVKKKDQFESRPKPKPSMLIFD